MVLTYMAVELDDVVHERESAYWLSKGVSSVRVTSMNEAIEKAKTSQFLFIGINSDNINYKPKLKILRDVTCDPIFIASSDYTTEEHLTASSLGADLYGKAGATPEVNYDAVMFKISQLNERANQRKKPITTLFHSNVLAVPFSRQVFLNDTIVALTKKEFEIVCFFMSNRLLVLTFSQIYSGVWGDDYSDNIHTVIRNHIKKINRKFNEVSPGYNFIVNEYGVGYKLRQT